LSRGSFNDGKKLPIISFSFNHWPDHAVIAIDLSWKRQFTTGYILDLAELVAFREKESLSFISNLWYQRERRILHFHAFPRCDKLLTTWHPAPSTRLLSERVGIPIGASPIPDWASSITIAPSKALLDLLHSDL